MTTPCGGYQFGNRGRIAPINREGGGPPSDILKVPEKYPSDAKTRIEDVNICAVRDRKAQHVPLLSTARTSYLQLVYMREASGTTITLVIHFQTRSRVRLNHQYPSRFSRCVHKFSSSASLSTCRPVTARIIICASAKATGRTNFDTARLRQ